jgi:tight adherence protein B
MESVDFDWAVLAISIQREVGGNLAEVLQTAAETMLHRNRLRREMKALTAEGRISAIVLGALPVGLFLFLYSTNRDYLEPLFTSTAGIAAMVGALVLLGVGIFWLTRIVRIEV